MRRKVTLDATIIIESTYFRQLGKFSAPPMREFRILGLIHAVSLEEALSQERSRAIARAETDKRSLMGSSLRQQKAAVSRDIQ
ncbi:MAG: hypothetical protein CMO61_02565 [Verrucomicrobiales bacterium]|nr:hypothetical protein [Verrucomicrobiales bacterium]